MVRPFFDKQNVHSGFSATCTATDQLFFSHLIDIFTENIFLKSVPFSWNVYINIGLVFEMLTGLPKDTCTWLVTSKIISLGQHLVPYIKPFQCRPV